MPECRTPIATTPVVTATQPKTTAAELSPVERLSLKNVVTPTTFKSSTPLSSSTIDTCASRPDNSLSSASYNSPYTLPSPSRSRLDRRYAKRLALPSTSNSRLAASSTHHNPLSSAAEGSSLLPPPGISRDSSIFRPTSILSHDHAPSVPSPLNTSTRTNMFPLTRESSSHSSWSASSTSSRARNFGQRPQDIGVSDRFIPSRATSSMRINLWDSEKESSGQAQVDDVNDPANGNSSDDSSSSNQGSNGRNSDGATSSRNLHNLLLRSELLGENVSPYGSNTNSPRSSQTTPPQRDGASRLRFQSPRQAFQENVFNSVVDPSSVVNNFSLTPVGSSTSQRLMASPQKRSRRIAKVPFKVLDAPALQDDFYLNLVDWSSQNVLAVGLSTCVYLWSACTSKITKLCDLSDSADYVTSVSWAQRGTHLAVGTHSGETQLWDTIACKKVRSMKHHYARVGALAWTGPMLASGSRDRLIFLQDVRANAFSDRMETHKQEVCGLKWSYDEPSFLASGGNDNQLHVVDSRNPGNPLHRFSDHTAAVKAITWSPHQHGLLASGGGTADRCIRFWNTLSGSCLNCIDTGSQVCNLAWSQNCNEIVSTHGYSLNQIVVWRYPSLSKVVTLTGHTYRVLYLAVSPDGSTIVTGAGDETLRFWQVFPGPRSDGKNNAGGLLFPNTLGSVIR